MVLTWCLKGKRLGKGKCRKVKGGFRPPIHPVGCHQVFGIRERVDIGRLQETRTQESRIGPLVAEKVDYVVRRRW